MAKAPQVFVRGIFYDRMGEETLKFKVDVDLIEKALSLKKNDEIDAFLDEIDIGQTYDLIASIVGNKDIAKQWKKDHSFGVALEEFVFGVGDTKEKATMRWSEVMDDNGGNDGWG